MKTKTKNPDACPVQCNRTALSGSDLVRQFIMENPAPPPWGPLMAREIRDRLTAVGFHVSRCSCVEEHPVVAITLRGPTDLTVQQMRRCIRKLAKDLGHCATPGGMAIVGQAGRFDGAFVMEAEFGATQPCLEIFP
jgi:hypothetical protein